MGVNKDIIAYLIDRLLREAEEASAKANADNSDEFLQGKNLAYYEMLSMLKEGLDMYDLNLSEYGLEKRLETLL